MKYKFLLMFSVLFIVNSYSQCGASISCNSNAGVYANDDATNIEYDNMGTSYHSSFVKEDNADWKVWGEFMSNDGFTQAFYPIAFTQTNYPALTGSIYKMAIASQGGTDLQLIVLTYDGLFVLGKNTVSQNAVLDPSLTTSFAFQRITVNGKTDGLPINVSPNDVKMMFATERTLTITTCAGFVYVLSQNSSVRGNGGTGSATLWSQVMENSTTPISNVIVARGNFSNAFALKSDGTIWTWGENTLLGDGSAFVNRNYATQMTMPLGIPSIKMIQMTAFGDVNLASNNINYSYYILGTDKKVYALGRNNHGQLGDRTSTDSATWVNCLNPDGSIINNANWISANEHDHDVAGFAIITTSGKLFTCGTNDNYMVARAINNGINYLDIPSGINATDIITFVEIGGHCSTVIKQTTTDYLYGYMGHRTNGSMGGGSGNGIEPSVNFSNGFTPPSNRICGSRNGILATSQSNILNFIVSPNPFSSTIKIETTDTVSNYSIYDITGKQLINTTSKNELDNQIIKISNGIYLLKLNFEDGKIYSQKIIKI